MSKRLFILIAAVPLSANAAPVCTLINDGTMDTYVHELAHCNGWDHPADAPWDVFVPPKFIHPYYGPMVVIIGDGSKGSEIIDYIQANAKVRFSKRSVERLCTDSAKGRRVYHNTAGCAPVLGRK